VTVPGWWNERRYGLFVHSNIATVPSFSPIGEYADWYWSHLGTDPLEDVILHPTPMAEVLAYHRDRWAHVERFDDFIPFLSYHRFDADELLELATSAGTKYLVHVTKHHDGFCWWDAPGTKRTSVLHGPQRNIVAEIAQACRRSDVVYGTYYSLLDWGDDRYPDPEYVEEVLHRHVLDLVERYGTQILWGDGHWGHGPDVWRSAELIERAQDLADAQGFELLTNDRWWHPSPNVATYEYNPPDEIRDEPWELCRGVGSSFGNNRVEREEHMLSTGALFDLLTEVIAKGGNLLINVGPAVDGTVPELQQQPLRAVGTWVNQHADVVHRSRPFDVWGDAQVRYVRVDAEVIAVDLAAGSELILTAITPDRYEVAGIDADDGGAIHWEQSNGGVTVSRIDRSPTGLAGVYRMRLREAPEAIRLFDERDSFARSLQPLLEGASPGDVVQLHEGRFQGPATVPRGVTLRGMGWDRTAILGGGQTAVTLQSGARLENIHLLDGPARVFNFAAPIAVLRGSSAVVSGCKCDGHLIVEGDDAVIRSVIGIGVIGAIGVERVTIERCAFKGMRWDVGIQLDGGSGHLINRSEVVEHLCNIRLSNANAATVSENRLEGRWWGAHLVRCDNVEVVDNTVQHTMRAVNVEGGSGCIVTGNWIADGDSGALIEFGATETAVIDNHVERCRLGVLVWDAPTTRVGPNTFVDLHEEQPIVRGPDTDAD
jgi:alpha-L-fucosidase